MLSIKKEGIILEKTSLEFESVGVLNPASIVINNQIFLFYRAVAKNNYSTIGLCKLNLNLEIIERLDIPLLFPQFDYEKQGTEDPRIVIIDGLYYLTYTAFDGVRALGALAVSNDLKNWHKKGILVPQLTFDEFYHISGSKEKLSEKYQRNNGTKFIIPIIEGKKVLLWDKNLIFFPRRINGKLYFLHRIKPDIQIVSITNIKELTTSFWENYLLNFKEHIMLSSKFNHEISYVGGGCPPIETQLGWLIIYHGVQDSIDGYIYNACAALFELDNPQKEIARLPYPLFKPEFDWELHGIVNNTCFPTGTVIIKDILYIFYGAADEHIACASVNLSELLKELILNTTNNENNKS